MLYTDLHYFGALSYYTAFAESNIVLFDTQTAFSKMSFKNRMVIASAQGPLHLTIPIIGGRDQKTPMNQIHIFNDYKWKTQHYKSICTNYKRAPFFDYYVDSLSELYTTEYEMLNEFLLATQNWIKKQLKARWEITINNNTNQHLMNVEKYIPNFKPNNFMLNTNYIQYQQVFEDVTGFIPNLCVLDLIFAVGGKSAFEMLSSKKDLKI